MVVIHEKEVILEMEEVEEILEKVDKVVMAD